MLESVVRPLPPLSLNANSFDAIARTVLEIGDGKSVGSGYPIRVARERDADTDKLVVACHFAGNTCPESRTPESLVVALTRFRDNPSYHPQQVAMLQRGTDRAQHIENCDDMWSGGSSHRFGVYTTGEGLAVVQLSEHGGGNLRNVLTVDRGFSVVKMGAKSVQNFAQPSREELERGVLA